MIGQAPYFGFGHRPQRRHHADGRGLRVLDGFGGIHDVGTARRLVGNAPYWPGWDIARSLSLSTDGRSMVMLDGFGAVWRFGDAVPHARHVLRLGHRPRHRADARTATATSVLDGFGAVHRFGPGTPGEVNYGYVPFDRWRGLAIRNGHVYEVRNDGFSAG